MDKSQTIESIYEKWSRHLSKDELSKTVKFLKDLKTSNTERVLHVSKQLEDAKLFPKVYKSRKSDKISTKYRNLGNKEFVKKKLFAAWEHYNKAIAYAETDKSTECLALGYANRSAVLFEWRCYEDSVWDINQSLALDYPVEKRSKLQARLDKISKSGNGIKYEFNTELPDLHSKPVHPTINCARDVVKIEYKQDVGRHVIATKTIDPGEIIVVERPYASTLLLHFWYRICNYCLKQKLNLIPCEKCPYALFCDKSCKEKAYEKYHRYECEIYNPIVGTNLNKMAHISLRITITAREHYPAIAKDVPWAAPSDKTSFQNDYSGIHNLVTNIEHMPANEITHKSVAAALLLNFLQKTSFFNDLEMSDGVNVAAELLLRHLLTAPSNFHSISACQPFTENSAELQQIGCGAYPFMSLFNHSCAPNLFRTSYGNVEVLIALRPIKAGMQLFDNYGNHHALKPRVERQYALSDQYYFECKCEACIADWPLWGEGRIPQNMQLTPDDFKQMEVLIRLLMHRKWKAVEPKFGFLVNSLKVLEKLAPCKPLCEFQETFKEYFFQQGNVFQLYDQEQEPPRPEVGALITESLNDKRKQEMIEDVVVHSEDDSL